MKKFPLSCGLSRSDVLAAAVVACFVGILGLWPHLNFAREIGEWQYFHGAYDEDNYILSWLLGTLRSTRGLSGFALSIVYALCSSSLDATLIVSDFIFPFLATCAAYFAASQLISSRPARILTALALVFADDLFSLGNLAVWTSSPFNISGFTRAIGMIGPNLVPAYETSFLAIFRTPEPQVSFSLMFLNLGLLARFATIDRDRGPAAFAVAIVALSLLPIGYTFVTFPTAAIAGASLVVFAFFRKRATATVAIGLLAAVLVSLATYYWNNIGGQTTTGLATDLSYHTRAPIVTPAVIGSLIFGVSFGLWMILGRRWQPLAFLALAYLLMPAMLSNQQIITGIMFSARDWERTVSYPVLVFGVVAALSVIVPLQAKRPHLLSPLCWCVVIALVVSRGQQSSFGFWKPYNLESIAIIRALKAVDPATLDRASLAFEDVGIAPLVQVRAKKRLNVALTFYQAAMHFVPNMAPEAKLASPSPYEDSVFEQWLRIDMSPEKAEQLLYSDVRQRAGPYLNHLFSFRDAWYPASDNRAVRQQEVERTIEPIIGRYRNYLMSQIHRDFDRPALLVSAQSPAELRSSPWINNEYIGMGSAEGVAAYVYRQSRP